MLTPNSKFVSVQNRNKLDLRTITIIAYTMNSFLMANNSVGGAMLGTTTVRADSRRTTSRFVTMHTSNESPIHYPGTTEQGKYLTSNNVAGWGTL
jgi:hypothetical protein